MATRQKGLGVTKASYELGLTPVLDTVSGPNGVWSQRTVDISAYRSATAYLVFEYINGAAGFTGDIQLDLIDFDNNVYDFEIGTEQFQTTSGNPATYSSVTWSALTTGTAGGGLFLRDASGTTSTGTGLTTAASGSFYVYAETSSPATVSGYKFWLRSPLIALSNSPTLSYYEAREGVDMGTLNVYLDIIE
jgi:hypothetical protein